MILHVKSHSYIKSVIIFFNFYFKFTLYKCLWFRCLLAGDCAQWADFHPAPPLYQYPEHSGINSLICKCAQLSWLPSSRLILLIINMSRKTTNFFSGFLPLQCFFTHSTRLLIELGFLFLRNAVEKLFWKKLIWKQNYFYIFKNLSWSTFRELQVLVKHFCFKTLFSGWISSIKVTTQKNRLLSSIPLLCKRGMDNPTTCHHPPQLHRWQIVCK